MGKAKKKRGAPVKPPEQRKGHAIQIRLTQGERESCEAAASESGLKLAEWARDALIKATEPKVRK